MGGIKGDLDLERESYCRDSIKNQISNINILDSKNMTVLELKKILENLPDDMKIVIPIVDKDNISYIYKFRYVRKAAILTDELAKDQNVFCLNGSSYNTNISKQISDSGRKISVKDIDF